MSAVITWLSGVFIDSDAPAVRADDDGVLSGRGVFETLLILEGTAVWRTRHLARLARSAAIVGVAPHVDAVNRGIDTVLGRYEGTAPGRLRVTVTASGAVLVTAGPLPAAPETAAVMISPWRRNERSPLAGAKSTSYADNLVAYRHARSLGYDEALLPNSTGLLCEGTRSNVFVEVGGRLVTPPLSSGCLAGIVRALVVESGLATEREVTLGELQSTNEAFLTSSLRVAQPIHRVDRRALAQCPGPLTEAAIAAVRAQITADADA